MKPRSDLNSIIRQLVREELEQQVGTNLIRASDAYAEREAIKDDVQSILMKQIGLGKISTQDQFDEFFKTIDMTSKALRMVKFETYKKIIGNQ